MSCSSSATCELLQCRGSSCCQRAKGGACEGRNVTLANSHSARAVLVTNGPIGYLLQCCSYTETIAMCAGNLLQCWGHVADLLHCSNLWSYCSAKWIRVADFGDQL